MQKLHKLFVKKGSAILNAYASKRAFTKAVSRTRQNLPVSPHKASVVINELASEYGITTKRAKISASQLPQSTVMAVKDFYCCDDISRQAPRRHDYVTIRDEQGVKTQVQKHHLVMTIKETHTLLKADLGMDHPIGKSKFGDLRPWHVLFMQDIPANTCVCQHHENPNLLLGALNWQLMLTLPAF